MEVAGDASLIYASGEVVDAAAVLKAAGFDPEHFIFHVKRLPSAPNAPLGKCAMNRQINSLMVPRGDDSQRLQRVEAV